MQLVIYVLCCVMPPRTGIRGGEAEEKEPKLVVALAGLRIKIVSCAEDHMLALSRWLVASSQ